MIKGFIFSLVAGLLLLSFPGRSQEKPAKWDLKSCIEYARQRNIQIRKNRIALEESLENTRQAKAQQLPSLSFSSGHNFANRPGIPSGDKNLYNGSYNLNSNLALYNGGKLKKNIRQMELQDQVQQLTIREAENNIELAITQYFVQVLYANEHVKINEYAVEVAKAQRDRGKELVEAGALAQPDFAQLESQYTSDKYQLVIAQSSLANSLLDLKQLLELGVLDDLELQMPELSDDSILMILPSRLQVFQTALGIMPEVEYNRLNIQVASIEKQKAWAGFLPELNLSVGLGTSHVSGSGYDFGRQLRNNWSESVGLTLSVPIYSKRSNRTSVNLAQLNVENAELNLETIQKDLLKDVENVWQDAVSAQEQFRAARENLNAVEQTFALVEQQFFLGMKNTLEMLTEKNNLLSARQEVLQAKYMAVLNLQLLNFYQGKPIQIK